MYYFISGYTAKVAGTEMGVTEPQATFSPCFGGPFLVWHPSKYAELLAEKMRKHNSRLWLVNTGWTGGPYGVGARMPIEATRALLHAALFGELVGAPCRTDEIFQLAVPVAVDGVDPALLDPRSTWSDPLAYDAKARELAGLFRENFKQFADVVRPETAAAGPVG